MNLAWMLSVIRMHEVMLGLILWTGDLLTVSETDFHLKWMLISQKAVIRESFEITGLTKDRG